MLEFKITHLPKYPQLPIGSASTISANPVSYDVLVVYLLVVPQVISIPYDPSSVEYDAKPDVNVILRNRVKQEGVHRNASHAENNIPIVLVQEAPLYVCPKISDSLNRKQWKFFMISGNEDKENKPAKVARHTLVSLVKPKDITDTDEELETPLVRDKRSTPREPFGNHDGLSRSNKQVTDNTAQGIQWQTTV